MKARRMFRSLSVAGENVKILQKKKKKLHKFICPTTTEIHISSTPQYAAY
jgi:hypothetical protein